MDNRSSLAKLAEATNFDFPNIMRFLREKSGLSARQLSSISGLSPSYISKMENGNLLPTVDAFSKIITNLNMTDAEIIFVVRSLNKNKNLSEM